MDNRVSSLIALVGNPQHRRLLRLSFPHHDGPAAELLVNSIDAVEGLSRMFEYTVELLSNDPSIELKDLQGKLLCVELVRGDGTLRYFTGHVFSSRLKKADGGICYYEVTLGPWLRYLTLRKDNYLFHASTTYDHTSSTFEDYGAAPRWEWRVRGDKEIFTDWCQFDETDANFLQRRWLAAGVAYWFEHTDAGHTLVLSDDTPAVSPIDGSSEVRFQKHGGIFEEDGISQWTPVRELVASKVAVAAYDFKAARPATDEVCTLNKQGDVPVVESYEYAGAYGFKGDSGHKLSGLHMESFEAAGKHFEAAGNNRFLIPGRWFRLVWHFDAAQPLADPADSEFLITEVTHYASNNYQSAHFDESCYENCFRCVRKAVPYRLPHDHGCVDTKIFGIQTAVVVGPVGEEIYTDEYGRVKVQFHWDRVGEREEKSSAWLRVSTPWAGENFGMTSIPRIGAEVIVQFLDGNPDRPIITGMVPNAHTMPPWKLPANKTQSGILSRSTPNGQYDHANALRFEDKKGAEQLWLHAEKDQLTEVEHDEDKWVGNDRRKTVDRDETSHIKRNRTETVDHDETITVHNNRTERVDMHERISIGGNREKTVERNEKDDIAKNWSTYVGRYKTETVAMGYMQNVGLGRVENVGLGYMLNVGAIHTVLVGASQIIKVGQKISISAGDELEITVGASSFVMKSDGSVTINGTRFNFEASGPVQISGKDVDIN